MLDLIKRNRFKATIDRTRLMDNAKGVIMSDICRTYC